MSRRPQDVVNVLAVARPCSKCKQPTIFATKRGRAVHPCCESDWNADVDPAGDRRRLATVIETLRPTRVAINPPVEHRPHYSQDRPYEAGIPPYPCAACGQWHDVIRWLPQDVWRCPKHNPLTFPVQPWEGRGWPTHTPRSGG